MPQYRVQIFKSIGGGKEWSNTYHIFADTLALGIPFIENIVEAETTVHKQNVDFIRARISTETPDDGVFATVPLNTQGQVLASSDQLPLWNVVRVDFGVFGGRPSYKFLRLPLQESEQANGILTGGVTDTVQLFYANVLLALSNEAETGPVLVDESGNFFNSADVFPRVQMRQLSRRRRRTTSGGISTS